MSQSYPSDLTDEQWELLSGLIPSAKPGGRPRHVDMQAVVNAILYILCAGCGRMLTHDFLTWKTVYHWQLLKTTRLRWASASPPTLTTHKLAESDRSSNGDRHVIGSVIQEFTITIPTCLKSTLIGVNREKICF